jgi:hypothetical protein
MSAVNSFNDCLARPVKVGDLITYPGRRGSSMWINHGRVVEIVECKNWYDSRLNAKVKIERSKVLSEWDIKWTSRYKNCTAGDVVATYSWIYCTDRTTKVG